MIKNKIFLKKIISFLPMPLNNLIRKIYGKGQNITYFLPLELNENFEKIELKKFFKLNLKNFNLLKTNYKYFLVFKKRPVKDFLVEKLRKMKNYKSPEKQ